MRGNWSSICVPGRDSGGLGKIQNSIGDRLVALKLLV
jgi:hypothetical protein